MNRWLPIAVLALAFAGYKYWQSQQIPAPTLEPGEMAGGPALSAPGSVRITREEAASSILIAQERPEQSGPRSNAPAVFERPAISSDSLALAKPPRPVEESLPWWQRLDAKFVAIFAAAAFIGIYMGLTAVLKRD